MQHKPTKNCHVENAILRKDFNLGATSSFFHAFHLGVNWFLALAKPFGGKCQILMGEVFYQLVNMVLCLEFHDAFTFHLSPY
jgi:hypothetical protein